MKNIFYLFGFLLTCSGCNFHDLDFGNLQPPVVQGVVAVPLGELSYTIEELIIEADDKLELYKDERTSMLMFIYRDTTEFANASKIIKIPDVVSSSRLYLPVTRATTDSQVVVLQKTLTFYYPAQNGERLDSLFYETGSLDLDLTQSFPYDLTYDMVVQNTVNVRDESPIVFSNLKNTQPLSGYKTLLHVDEELNTFSVDVELQVVIPPGEQLSQSDHVIFDLTYSNQSFTSIYGWLGQDTIEVGNKFVDVKFLDKLGSDLKFGSPELRLHFKNKYGLPLKLALDEIYATSGGAEPDTSYLDGIVTESPHIIGGAEFPGETSETIIKIDNSNSSLRDLLNMPPDKVGFSVIASTNPKAKASVNNFIHKDSQLSSIIEMKVPLTISLNNMVTTVNFDNGKGLQFDKSDSMVVRVIAENELPLSAVVGLEIRDENNAIIHTIDNERVLEAPEINAEGLVTEPRQSVCDFAIPEAGIQAFNRGKKLTLRLTMNTPQTASEETYVNILADYAVTLRVSAIGRLKYPLK